MVCADGAGWVLGAPEGLAEMMVVVMVACQEFGITLSKDEIESMHPSSIPSFLDTTPHIEAVGHRYKQVVRFVYLGGDISAEANISIKIKRRIGAACARLPTYSSPLSKIGPTPGTA